MGVEINSDAIHNARHNAKQNHVKNMKFVDMDSTEFMMEAKRYNHHFDVIVLDPPRAGTTKPFIEAATALNPRKICYISCDPKTLMRDLKGFKKCGYTTNKIELVDMFPKTEHIECICVLEKHSFNVEASKKKQAQKKQFQHQQMVKRKKKGYR